MSSLFRSTPPSSCCHDDAPAPPKRICRYGSSHCCCYCYCCSRFAWKDNNRNDDQTLPRNKNNTYDDNKDTQQSLSSSVAACSCGWVLKRSTTTTTTTGHSKKKKKNENYDNNNDNDNNAQGESHPHGAGVVYHHLSLAEMEDVLESALDDRIQPLHYIHRDDFVWLNCRRPALYPMESVLGLEEEETDVILPSMRSIALTTYRLEPAAEQRPGPPQQNNHDNPNDDNHISTTNPLKQQLHEVEETSSSTPPCGCTCAPDTIHPVVHSRSDPEIQKTTTTTTENDNKPTVTRVQWVDGRSLSSSSSSDFAFSSMATCVHFLRSLLDARHDASPWVPNRRRRTRNTHNDDDKDMVILILHRQALPEKLIEFRVSDACPSWFLHAVGHLQKVNSQTMPWVSPNDDQSNHNHSPAAAAAAANSAPKTITAKNNDNGDTDSDLAVMLIYRRLPPRAALSVEHPVTRVPFPHPGCLWETYHPPASEQNKSDDDKNNNNNNNSNNNNNEEQEGESTQPQPPVVQYRPVGPPIVNPLQEYPGLLEPLLVPEMIRMMQHEALHNISQHYWTAWPEQQHYKASSETGQAPWHVFPLCHTFPAHDLTKRKWVSATCAAVPQTVHALQRILGDTLRTALFSRLDPESVLEAHTGWEDLANHVLRVHIPLIIPPGNLCGVWVDGCVQLHQPPRVEVESSVLPSQQSTKTTKPLTAAATALCFDDSKTHRAFNYSKQARIVLILDLVRPATIPLGYATGGHSDELDEFIGKMGMAR